MCCEYQYYQRVCVGVCGFVCICIFMCVSVSVCLMCQCKLYGVQSVNRMILFANCNYLDWHDISVGPAHFLRATHGYLLLLRAIYTTQTPTIGITRHSLLNNLYSYWFY